MCSANFRSRRPTPPGGGNGPGTYAYPTAANADGSAVFAPGSFRLTGLTVINSGPTVSFQIGIANLQPTFGSLLGAQLIDLYIHAPPGGGPAGETQSTAAAGAWNYSIAPADAWNQLIEVDGFGNDDARTFTATPGQYTFGVCSAAVAGGPSPPAVCSASPGSVPLVMDTIPPAAVDVQTELDPTAHPSGVVLQGTTVP